MPTLKDWVVQLQFDDSKVTKGIKDLDEKFKKLDAGKAKRSGKQYKTEQRFQNAIQRAEITAYKEKEARENRIAAQKQRTSDKAIKTEIDAYKEKEARESRLSKQKEREIRQEKRNRLAIYKAESAAYAENARRKIKADKEAFRNQTKLTPLSFRGRLSEEQRIGRSQVQARGALSSLSGRTDKKSVRLASSLQREIQRLEAAQKRLSKTTYTNTDSYQRLSRSLQVSRNNVSSFSMQAKKLNREMNAGKFASDGFSSSLKNMARSYISVFAVFGTVSKTLTVAKDFERIRSVMLLSSSSAKDAGENFEFVGKLANYLGADISATADAFAGFNVSAMSAGVSAEDSKNIFTQLSTAVQATGLDAHRSGLAFLAFKQMMAGPVIQAQEMNQVVEQMPQFTGLAIKALKEMGYEGENFRKIIATGTVDSAKFVSIVARLSEEQAANTGAAAASRETLIASQNRMNNTFKAMADTIAKAGLKDIMKDIFDSLSSLAQGFTPVFSSIVWGISKITGAIRMVVEPINTVLEVLGFDHGLGSVLAGIATVLATGALVKGILSVIKVVKALGVASAITKGILGGPAGLALALGGGLAASYGAEMLFNRALSDKVGSNSSTSQVNNNQVNQTLNVTTGADPMKIARLSQDAIVQGLSS